MDYEIVNKKRVLRIIQTLDCSRNEKYEFKHTCILDLLEVFFCFWFVVEDLRVRFKIAMVNHFPFLFRFHFAKLIFENLFTLVRERYERVNTHVCKIRLGGKEANCNFCLFSRSLSFLVFCFFRVPFLWQNIKFRK
jgi:hypothetical protein